jgi:exodeoxyribonuclease V gamma subunit
MEAWAEPLRWLVDTLLRPQRSVDAATHAFAAQAAHVREVVDALVSDAVVAGVGHPIDVRELRAALADRFVGGGSRARLRTGHVSVASLAPLRGVPFRVIAVVGAGDALLGASAADDDDVPALAPRIGERDTSGERRAALLDAVLAARGTLIVTCDGQDVRTGATLDLPTIVEELLDALPAAAGHGVTGHGATGHGEGAGAPLVVRHPRHLADRRNLTVGAGSLARVDRSRPWTFSLSALRALEAYEAASDAALRPAAGAGVLTVTTSAPHWRTLPLGPPRTSSAWAGSGAESSPRADRERDALVELRIEDVVEALRRPARVLLRERLGVRLPRDLTSDPRSIELWVDDPLARWAIGQDLLAHLTAGGTVEGWIATRPAYGGLPPGRLGRALLASFVEEVTALHDAAGRPVTVLSATIASRDRPGSLARTSPVGVELDVARGGAVARVRLVGSVTHLDGTVVDVRYSRDHAAEVLSAGVALLAAVAQGPVAGATDAPIEAARIVRRAPSSARDTDPVRRDLAVQGDDPAERAARARVALTELVDLALRVRSGPAALLPRSAWSIDATTDVRLPPSGTFKQDVERDLDDPAVSVVLGVSALSDLADQEDGPLEDGLPEAPTPVQRWSLALRGPLERPFALATAPATAPATEEVAP